MIDHPTLTSRPAASADCSFAVGLLLLALALIVRLGAVLLIWRGGFQLATMDEAIRWRIAGNWANAPFWFTFWDGIWLTGGIAFWGTLRELLPNPLMALTAGCLALHTLCLAGAFCLGRVVSRTWLGGGLAALLLAPAVLFIWTGLGPLAEPLLIVPFLFALAALWAWLRRELRSAADHCASPSPWPPALAAGLLFFAAMSIHYLTWIALLAAAPLLAVILFSQRRRLRRGVWRRAALVAALTLAFPVLWCIGSAYYLGSPLQFLRNQNAFINSIGGYGALSALERLQVYPRELARALLGLMPLLLITLLTPLARTARPGFALALRRIAPLLLLVLMILGLMIASVVVGGSAQSPFRSTVIPLALMLIALGAVLGAGLGPCLAQALIVLSQGSGRFSRAPLARMLALATLTLLAYGAWTGYNLLIANRHERYLTEHLPHDLVATGAWLRQEIRHPLALTNLNPQTRIAVRSPHSTDLWPAYFEYISGLRGFIELRADAAPQGCTYLLQFELPTPAPPWQPIATFGGWIIYRDASLP